MILYQIRTCLKDRESQFSLSIDPGLNSSGLCFLNKKTFELNQKTISRNIPISVVYPELLVNSYSMFNLYLKEIKERNISLNELELNIEYSFIRGSYIPELTTQITVALVNFINLGINKITLLPAKIPGYFLQTGNEKVKEYLLLEWFKAYFPEYISDSPHSRDAFLTSLFCHFDLFKIFNTNVLELRTPKYELVKLDYMKNKGFY